MGRSKNLVGRMFGKSTVLCRLPNYISPKGQTQVVYSCKCGYCGKIFSARYSELVYNGRVSCGCIGIKNRIASVTKHGFSHKEPLYTTWKGIRERCNNPNTINHANYADRGVRVCSEWNDYPTFREWALSHGWKHGLTIDRIDNNKGYSPDNCRVVTNQENCRNKRCNINITINGRTQCLRAWCLEYKTWPDTINKRVRQEGMTYEEAILCTNDRRKFSNKKEPSGYHRTERKYRK